MTPEEIERLKRSPADFVEALGYKIPPTTREILEHLPKYRTYTINTPPRQLVEICK